ATWAISAAAAMNDGETVGRLLSWINPALHDPDTYWAEPYVLPGNVDGPESRAGRMDLVHGVRRLAAARPRRKRPRRPPDLGWPAVRSLPAPHLAARQ